MDRTPNKSQRTKLALEKTVLPPRGPTCQTTGRRSELKTPLSRAGRLPLMQGEMGGAKLIIEKHVACHGNKDSPHSRKENMLSQLTGLGVEYSCKLLPQKDYIERVLS